MKRRLQPPASSWALGAAAMVVVVWVVVATAVGAVVAEAVLPGAISAMVGVNFVREEGVYVLYTSASVIIYVAYIKFE